jgi:phosphoribosylformimino-5-aminoimidazole carboxamide ribonucleotide (ProFAR) isomerase
MKNETTEQAAHRILTEYGIKSIGQSIGVIKVQELMVEMAKWQQERMYSEEEVLEILEHHTKYLETFIYQYIDKNDMEENKIWFEQFKNK